VVVYDITSSVPLSSLFFLQLTPSLRSRRSFDALQSWLSDARALASPDLQVVVVGNKVDQEEDRQVPYLEASRWAQDNSAFATPLANRKGGGTNGTTD
jgi:GTPase SAR1 family protein